MDAPKEMAIVDFFRNLTSESNVDIILSTPALNIIILSKNIFLI